MGMLDRYKKKGGFQSLLQLLETSPIAKREQFLVLIGGESQAWEEELRKRILTIERVYSWDGQYLVEIFTRVQPMTLAYALSGSPEERIDSLLECLPPISKRKITDLMAESQPTLAEKSTCIAKMLVDVRGLISQGVLRLDKVDPEMIIPENIEDALSHSSTGVPLFEVQKKDGSPNIVGEADNNEDTSEEVSFLKRKLNQVITELNSVKQENLALKEKLAQIKKIA